MKSSDENITALANKLYSYLLDTYENGKRTVGSEHYRARYYKGGQGGLLETIGIPEHIWPKVRDFCNERLRAKKLRLWGKGRRGMMLGPTEVGIGESIALRTKINRGLAKKDLEDALVANEEGIQLPVLEIMGEQHVFADDLSSNKLRITARKLLEAPKD